MSNYNFAADSNKDSSSEQNHLRHRRMVEPLISLYQDGEATEAEQRIVEQYLNSCAECRAIYQSYQQVTAGLRNYVAQIPTASLKPEDYAFLKEAKPPVVDQATRNTPILTAPSGRDRGYIPLTRRPARRWQPLFSLAGGMVAVLLIGLVALVYLAGERTGGTPVAGQPGGIGAVGSAGAIVSTQDATFTPTEASTSTFSPVETATPEVSTTQAAGTTAAGATPRVIINTPATPTPVAARAATTAPVQKPVTTVVPQAQATNTPPPASASPTVATSKTTAANSPEPTAQPSVTPEPATPEPTTPPNATLTTEATTAAPSVAATTAPVVTAAATTAPTPKVTDNQVFSAAPGWIAYVDRSDTEIHFVLGDGSKDQIVGNPQATKDVAWEQLVWSNDARWLAIVGFSANKGEREIYLLDSQNPRKLELLTAGAAPVWSPDSRFLAYLAAPINIRAGVKQGRPALFDLKKRTSSIIYQQPEAFASQWFDDSNRILVGQDRIYQIDNGQLSSFKLPFTNDCVGNSLSPNGNRLAMLEQEAGGKFETVIYDLSKGTLDPKNPLLRVAAPVQGAVGKLCGSQRLYWTHDGRNIYYYTSNNPGYSTCLIQATTGVARCLANVYDPSFNFEGNSLVDYNPSSGAGGLVYTMPSSLNGRPANPRLIAETRIPPVWQPR